MEHADESTHGVRVSADGDALVAVTVSGPVAITGTTVQPMVVLGLMMVMVGLLMVMLGVVVPMLRRDEKLI